MPVMVELPGQGTAEPVALPFCLRPRLFQIIGAIGKFLLELIILILWLPPGAKANPRNMCLAAARGGIYLIMSGLGYTLVLTIQSQGSPEDATWVTSTVSEALGVPELECFPKTRSKRDVLDFLFQGAGDQTTPMDFGLPAEAITDQGLSAHQPAKELITLSALPAQLTTELPRESSTLGSSTLGPRSASEPPNIESVETTTTSQDLPSEAPSPASAGPQCPPCFNKPACNIWKTQVVEIELELQALSTQLNQERNECEEQKGDQAKSFEVQLAALTDQNTMQLQSVKNDLALTKVRHADRANSQAQFFKNQMDALTMESSAQLKSAQREIAFGKSSCELQLEQKDLLLGQVKGDLIQQETLVESLTHQLQSTKKSLMESADNSSHPCTVVKEATKPSGNPLKSLPTLPDDHNSSLPMEPKALTEGAPMPLLSTSFDIALVASAGMLLALLCLIVGHRCGTDREKVLGPGHDPVANNKLTLRRIASVGKQKGEDLTHLDLETTV